MRTKGAENTENFAVLPEDPKTNIRRDLIDLLKRAVADNINPQRVLHYITGVIEHQAKNDGYSHSKVFQIAIPYFYPLFKLHKLTRDAIEAKTIPPSRSN